MPPDLGRLARSLELELWVARVRLLAAFEDRELIFDKFGRSSTGGSTKPGTGLGPFIARSIVEAHGGWVESSPGTGSVFTLELPLRARSEP